MLNTGCLSKLVCSHRASRNKATKLIWLLYFLMFYHSHIVLVSGTPYVTYTIGSKLQPFDRKPEKTLNLMTLDDFAAPCI